MCGPVDEINTSCDGSLTGSSRSNNWSTSVKMAVLAPMPRASEPTATKVNSGLRRRLRSAKLTSETMRLIDYYTSLGRKGYARRLSDSGIRFVLQARVLGGQKRVRCGATPFHGFPPIEEQ